MTRTSSRPLVEAAALAGVLVCWTAIPILFGIPSRTLPTPYVVALALKGGGFGLVADLARTLAVGFAGWFAAAVAGIAAAALLAARRSACRFAMPGLYLFGGITGIGAAPLLLHWAGDGAAAKGLLAAWLAFFPVAAGSIAGFAGVRPCWRDVMRSFSATRMQTFLLMRLPAALPAVAAALRRAWLMALLGVVLAEFLGAPAGVGGRVLARLAAADVAGALAALMVLAAGGGFTEWLLRLAERGALHYAVQTVYEPGNSG